MNESFQVCLFIMYIMLNALFMLVFLQEKKEFIASFDAGVRIKHLFLIFVLPGFLLILLVTVLIKFCSLQFWHRFFNTLIIPRKTWSILIRIIVFIVYTIFILYWQMGLR